MNKENKAGKLGTALLLDDIDTSRLSPAQKPVPKPKEGRPFVRIKWHPNKRTGKPYYYLVQNYYDEKENRRQRVLEYYGIRPPKGKKVVQNSIRQK